MIGVDIIELSRIADSIDRFGERFLQRVYTAHELAYCNGRINSLAARWAAKEAVAKALGTGIGEVSFQEIELVNLPSGQPTIRLHENAKTLADSLGLSGFAVSLSHSNEYAIAFVMGKSKSE